MKILVIPAEPYPTHEPFLGEIYSKEKDLFKTIFLMTTESLDLKNLEYWNSSKVYLFPRHSKYRIINSIKTYFAIDLRYLFFIPYIVIKEKIRIIQVRDLTFPLIIGLFFKYLFNRKLVYQKSHPHEYNKLYKAKYESGTMKYPKLLYKTRQIEDRILHKAMRFCDAVFPITKYMGKNLEDNHKINPDKIFPFGMGFNFEGNHKVADIKKGFPVRFVYIGTLAPARKIDVFLSGVAEYLKRYKDEKILFDFIGGTNEEVDELSQLVLELGLERHVQFYGKLDRYEVYRRLSEYHFGLSFVGPSRRFIDASPTKLMEYLAFGLPVLATKTVLMHFDIVKATDAGVLVEVDKDSVCSGIKKCVENYQLLAENALKYGPDYICKNHNYKKMKWQLVAIYKRMI